MIAHRASVFEENSVTFTERHRVAMKKGKVPHGYRAPWPDLPDEFRSRYIAREGSRHGDAWVDTREVDMFLLTA